LGFLRRETERAGRSVKRSPKKVKKEGREAGTEKSSQNPCIPLKVQERGRDIATLWERG